MFDFYLRHMRLATAAGVHIIPKHHLALHLWDRAAVISNPKEFAKWCDEHLNATLAALEKAAYPTVYERRVLSYLLLAYRVQRRWRQIDGPTQPCQPSLRARAALAHGSHHFPVSIVIITEAVHGGGPW